MDQTQPQDQEEGFLLLEVERLFGQLGSISSTIAADFQDHNRMLEQVTHSGGQRFTASELHQLLTFLVKNLTAARQLIRSCGQAARQAVNAASLAEDRRVREQKTIGMDRIIQAAAG